MICKKCGKEIEIDSKFCTFCGGKVEEIQEEIANPEEIQEASIEEVQEEQLGASSKEIQEVSIEEVQKEQPRTNSEEIQEEQQEANIEEVQKEQQEELPEEDKSKFSSSLYTNEFEYTKKIFNQYYRAEFISNSLAGYIVLQILLTNFFFIPGVIFAIVYWCITNPITKASRWQNFLFDNNGNQPLYRFFFEENTLIVRRNRVEECSMQYKDFRKIVFKKSGLMFISKKQDFFIPMTEIKNKEEIIEVLTKAKNVNFKLKIKK